MCQWGGSEAAGRERHAHYYLGWLEAMQAQYRSGAVYRVPAGRSSRQQDEGVRRARAELSNLTLTMEWITERGDLQFAMRWWDVTELFDSIDHLG